MKLLFAKQIVCVIGMVLLLVKSLLEFAIVESLMKVMTALSAKQATPKILKQEIVKRALSVKSKEVMKVAMDMELAINTVNKQFAHVI
jgi:hypothetical protein